MVQIADEKKSQNLELFKKKLGEVGIDSSILFEKYGENLKQGTYSISDSETSLCGDGTLLNTVMRTLTPIAIKLNGILPENKQVDIKSIIKVCLLHQISKSSMYTPNSNTWEVENRKIYYKYSNYQYALKMGMRSIAMCMECNIPLTENELEAISNLDREETSQTKFYSSPLAIILKQACDLTNLIGRNK